MRYWIAIVFLSLFVISCGQKKLSAPPATTTPDPATTQPVNTWNETQARSFRAVCVHNGTQGYPGYQASQFEAYCACLVNTIMRHWNYDDYWKDPQAHINQLAGDGTDAGCARIAGISQQ
jgi:hypothetical protein